MTKKLVSVISFMLCVCLFTTVVAFASPAVIGPDETGNSDSLIYLKKPTTNSVTTTERNYTITGAGIPGVEVTIYRRSVFDGNFYRVFQGGYMLEQTIGASGLFVVSIELVDGGNTIRINAENEIERQIIEINITRVSSSQIERINNLSIGDLFNAFQ